jgi:intracellular sulfur oxidation DsrE/DsrF family protein
VVGLESACTTDLSIQLFYGIDNPNLKLIDELNKTGVKVSVCDQSVAFHHRRPILLRPFYLAHRSISGSGYQCHRTAWNGRYPASPNLGLERVARVVNLYIASGVPADQLKFVVSVTGDATPPTDRRPILLRPFYLAHRSISGSGYQCHRTAWNDELNKTGVKVSVCDQSVAFHHYPNNWIDKSVVHALSRSIPWSDWKAHARPIYQSSYWDSDGRPPTDRRPISDRWRHPGDAG